MKTKKFLSHLLISIIIPGICLIMIIITATVSCIRSQQNNFQELNGPYMGQQPPGNAPVLFAPGLVCTGMEELVITFTPDGRECFWSVRFSGLETILTSRIEKGHWTQPEIAPFAGIYYDGWPAIQPDGKRMLFHSNRPAPDGIIGVTASFNIWYLDKTANGWSGPIILGVPVNSSENSTCPSVTLTGNLYISKRFADTSEKLCRSELKNGVYQELEILPPLVNPLHANFHGVISPDESYLVRPLYGRADIIGEGWNYYVSFRSTDGEWSDLINLGKEVNSVRCTAASSFSPDGRYLFFDACIIQDPIKRLDRKLSLTELQQKEFRDPGKGSSDIYWIETDFIEKLRPKQ